MTTTYKNHPLIVGAYKGKEPPQGLHPIIKATLDVLPPGYVIAPYLHAGEFPRVDVLAPGESIRADVVMTDEETGKFMGLNELAMLPPVSAPPRVEQAVAPKPVKAAKVAKAAPPAKKPAAKKAAPKAKKAAPKKTKDPVEVKEVQAAPTVPKKAAKAPPAAKAPKPAPKAAPVDSAPKGPTREQTFVEMLSRPQGATSKELEAECNWLPHSVRGFLGGTIKKKHDVTKIERGDGTKAYHIAPAADALDEEEAV